VFLLVLMFLRLPTEEASKAQKFGSLKRFLFSLDLGGSALLISSMVALFLTMQWGGQSLPWSSPIIIGLFVGFGVLVALFLLLEWRMGDDASVPFRIIKQRSIASGAMYLFFIAMPNYSVSRHSSMPFCARANLIVWCLHTNVLPESEGT
jgi:hypothetical protein